MTPPCLILTALATSGLRANYDQPLELGLLAVSRETFEPVDMFTLVMGVDPTSAIANCDEFVADMHTSNGLFDELVDALPAKFESFDAAAKDAAKQAVEFIERNGATGECRSPLICFGVDWLDRWLLQRFPTLGGQFKGSLDMSTVLSVQGKKRPKGDGRAATTLTQLFDALKGMRP